MSLTRNPNMQYVSVGQQAAPYERMRVRSNVRVPDAEARCDYYDGRPSYEAPQAIAREPITVSLRAVLMILSAAVIVLLAVYCGTVFKRASFYRQGRMICEEIRLLEISGAELDRRLAEAKEERSICYTAARDLQMIDGDSAPRDPVYAPSTRPGGTEKELAAVVHQVTLGH